MAFEKPKVFYGYWIVAVAFLCVFMQSGIGLYAFSLFVRPLQAGFGWSRGGIMAAFTIYTIVQGMASPFVGRLADRYGARKIIPTGAIIAGVGFAAFLSQMRDLWHFYFGYTVIGIGMAAMGHVPASAAVSNWFEKKRGLAIGIMSIGAGGGGFAFAPLVGGCLIPSFGWRASYLALALIIWVLIIPLVLAVMKTRPADMGLYCDDVEPQEATAMTSLPPSISVQFSATTALTTSTFWLIAIAFLFIQFCAVGTIQNQVPHLEDIGFPITAAATALGGVGFVSAMGKLGFGWLCDQIRAKYACAIGISLQFISIMVLMSVGPTSPLTIIWLYSIIMGLGMGSWLPTLSMLVSTNFGLASYGVIFGLVNLVQNIGCAAGPLAAAYMYDKMNTYHWAFALFLVLYVISIPSILALRPPKALGTSKGNRIKYNNSQIGQH